MAFRWLRLLLLAALALIAPLLAWCIFRAGVFASNALFETAYEQNQAGVTWAVMLACLLGAYTFLFALFQKRKVS